MANVRFPSIENGLTLLEIGGSRGASVLHALVLDHLLLNDGPALWVDADGHAKTTSLARLAPSRRLLDRIHVARGFTAYQHFSAICDLSDAVIKSTLSDGQPSLIVAPALDAQYRATDTLADEQASTLLARALARLASYAREYDTAVLLTRTSDCEFTEPISRAVDHHLQCEQTRMGPRFIGADFETLVYPVDDGAYYQTTIAYWRQLLAARATQVGVELTIPAPSPPTSDGVGTGVTAGGEMVSVTANPLLDAWAAPSTGGR